MPSECPSHLEVFKELERVALGVPLLALGQTALWDEPMKGAVILAALRHGFARRLIAGIHDTDYFAKHPSGATGAGYVALPHNDTTTRALWSAAGEFSALFGSETVVTRDRLQKAGANLAKVARERPGILDRVTEAWGWRGVVATQDHTTIIAHVPLGPLFAALQATFEWALQQTLDSIEGCDAAHRAEVVARFRMLVCDASEPCASQTLADFARRLLPEMYALAAGREVPLETTQTTELLRFNRATASLARFELLDRFLRPETRDAARRAYDAAITGTEIYPLERFGSWAMPFDLIVPGQGRGTLRIAPKAVIVMTPDPLFMTLKKPVASAADLAEAVERKFGGECTLVGKAVTLIGMLAREHVFVFHEGASAYVKYSRRLHQLLADAGAGLHLYPILRVRYEPWDALKACDAWLKLPEPLRQPFGVDDLCAPSFACRWRAVREAQRNLLAELARQRRPLDLIRFLATSGWGGWEHLATEYEDVHNALGRLQADIEVKRSERAKVAHQIRAARAEANRLFHAKGDYFRARLFERDATPECEAEWRRLDAEARAALDCAVAAKRDWQALLHEQEERVAHDEVQRAHARRRELELEAELKRIKLIRQAIVASDGLEAASHRPSAWWFPIVCPRGHWFDETTRRAYYYLEPLC